MWAKALSLTVEDVAVVEGESAMRWNGHGDRSTRSTLQQGGAELLLAIERFCADHPIRDVLPVGLRRVATTSGGEWSGPCPGCGGTDRLRVWPDHPCGRGIAWCRRCRTRGDALHWHVHLTAGALAPGSTAAVLRHLGYLRS